MGQAIGAAAGGAASAGGGSFLGTLFGAGGGFSSFLAGPGPGMILQIGLSLLARRKRKKEEERRIREGIEITGSPSIDFAPIVLGRRQIEQGVVVLKGNVVVNAGGRGWFQYTEVQAWAAAGRGGIGGIKEIWLDEDRYVVDAGNGIGGTGSDFVLYDPSTVPNAPTAPRNQWRYAIVEFPTYGESGKSEWANNRKWGYRSGAGAAANEAPGFELTVYDGSQTAADPGLVAKGSELHDWDRDFIGRNFAYTVMVFTRHGQNLSLWDKRGFPKIRVVLEGDKVPLTKAVQNTPASWTFSRNPAYLATYAHFELPVGTSIDANTPIDWTRVAAAATTADQTLTIPAGTIKGVAQSNTTEKRYNADVVVQGSATPAEIISQLELACDGDYLKVDGSWALEIPTSEADSGIELVDEMLASRATLIAGENLSSRFTSIAAAYIAPNENWKRVFTPEYESSTLLSKEGRALPRQDIALDAVTSPTQAWRLLLRQAYREEMQEQISIEGFHDLLRIRRGVNFKYKSDNLGISSFKRFVAENVSTESGSSPVVIVAREEDRARVYADPAIDDYPVYTDDQLVLPDTPPFPVQAMTARGVSGGIQLAITMPDIPGRIEIYDSPTSAWADASLKLVTTDSLVHIDYDGGTTRWFWARNNIGGEVSTRFPNDDVSTITATVGEGPEAAARIIKAVIGNAPRNSEWRAGVLWIDPTNGRQWRGAPNDPWEVFQQPGTYVASSKTVTWDDAKQNLVLGSDVSWTTAEGSIPEYGLDRTLLAVRGMANVEGMNDGVLFALQSGIKSFTATNIYGFVIDQGVPETAFVEGSENVILNSIDVNVSTSVVTAVFRDDVTGNYAVGPNFRKDGDKYTFVVRLGTTVYALPVKAGDDDDPYELVPPAGFIAAVTARRTAAIAGTEVPNASVALVDEDDWSLGSQWVQAFARVTRVQQAEYVTPYTGSDDVSPFSWPAVGDIPDFIDGAMQVLQLDRINLNWTSGELNRWVTIPEIAEEIVYTAVAERPLLPEQFPLNSWIYNEIADSAVTVNEARWASTLLDAGFSSVKEYAYRASRTLPIGSQLWQVEFWSHWGQGAPVSAVSRKQYGVRAPIRGNDGAWAFFDADGNNLLQDWNSIRKNAVRLDMSTVDRDGWRVLELERIQEGDLLTLEATDNQFASFRVTAVPTDLTDGKRLAVVPTGRYSDGDASAVSGEAVFYFQRLPLPKPSEVQKFLYNSYGNTDGLDGDYQFQAGTTNIGFGTDTTFKETVNKATRLLLAQDDAGANALRLSTLDLSTDPVLTFTLDRDGAWASWSIASITGPVAGQGFTINFDQLLAYENSSPNYSASTDNVHIGLTDPIAVDSSQLTLTLIDISDQLVGIESVKIAFGVSGKALESAGVLEVTRADVLFHDAFLNNTDTDRRDMLAVGVPFFATESYNADGISGTFELKLPVNPIQTYQVKLIAEVTYGNGRAAEQTDFVLRFEPELFSLSIFPTNLTQANNSGRGYTKFRKNVVPLGVKNVDALEYEWLQRIPDADGGFSLVPLSSHRQSSVARRSFNFAYRRKTPAEADLPGVAWYVRIRVKATDPGTQASAFADTDITIRLAQEQTEGASGSSDGPSGQQQAQPAGEPIQFLVGESSFLSYPSQTDVKYTVSGTAVSLEADEAGAALVTGDEEGSSTLRVYSGDTLLDTEDIVVVAPSPEEVYDVMLDAPIKAIPAGTPPLQITASPIGIRAYASGTDYQHTVTGSARLSSWGDGQNPATIATGFGNPYIVVPDSVEADEDFVLESRASQPGNFAVATRNLKITVLDYPNPPTALTVTSVTSSGFSLGWTAAAMATGKAPPTGYRVRVSNKDTGYTAAEHTTTGTSQAVTGLDPSTDYEIEVTTDSDSDFSRTSLTGEQTTSSATGTGTLPVPLAPTSLVFSSISATGMTVSWTAPTTSSGRAATTNYRVEVRTGYRYGRLVSTQTTTSTSLALTGLTAQTFYYISVNALSVAGPSGFLFGTASTISTQPVPAAPSAISFSNVSRTGFRAAWTPPAGASILYYRVQVSTDNTFVGRPREDRRFVPNITYNTLLAGTTYYLRVFAVSASGTSSTPLSGSQATSAPDVPNAPTALTFSSVTRTSMVIGWTGSARSNDRAFPTGYRLRLRTGSASGTIVSTLTPAESATSQAVIGLSAGTTYYVSLEANSTAGYSAALTGVQSTLGAVGTLFPSISGVTSSNEGTRVTFRAHWTGTAQGTPLFAWSTDGGTVVGSATSEAFTVDLPSNVVSDTTHTVTLRLVLGGVTAITTHAITVKNVAAVHSLSITSWTHQTGFYFGAGTGNYERIYQQFASGTHVLPADWFTGTNSVAERSVIQVLARQTSSGRDENEFDIHFNRPSNKDINVVAGKKLDFVLKYRNTANVQRTVTLAENRTTFDHTLGSGYVVYFPYRFGGVGSLYNEMVELIRSRANVPMTLEFQFGDAASGTTVFSLPNSPTDMSFSNIQGSSFVVGWTAPAGATVTGYRLRVRTGSASGTIVQTLTPGASATSQAVTRLAGTTTYYVSLEANTADGYGAALTSSVTTLVFALAVPSAPTALVFSSVTGSGMTVGWTAPVADFTRAAVTGYRLRIRTGSASGAIVQTLTPGASAVSQSITGLTTGTTYYVSLEANSSVGYSAALTGSQATAANQVPNAPTIMRFGSITGSPNRSFTVLWNAPEPSPSRAAVTGYRARVRTGGAAGTIRQTIETNAETTQATFTNIVSSTAYYVSVEANSSLGYSAALTGIPQRVPSRPQGRAYSSRTNTGFTANWAAGSVQSGQSPVTGYRLQVRLGERGPVVQTLTAAASATSLAITGLMPGTRYQVTARAFNSFGYSGEASFNVVDTTGSRTTVPEPTTRIKFDTITATSVRVSSIRLDPSSIPSTITGYRIRARTGSASGTIVRTVTSTSFFQTITGLTTGTTYYVTVEARNAIGYSAPGTAAAVTTQAASTATTVSTTVSGPWTAATEVGIRYFEVNNSLFFNFGPVLPFPSSWFTATSPAAYYHVYQTIMVADPSPTNPRNIYSAIRVNGGTGPSRVSNGRTISLNLKFRNASNVERTINVGAFRSFTSSNSIADDSNPGLSSQQLRALILEAIAVRNTATFTLEASIA